MPEDDHRFFHRADPPQSTPGGQFEFIMEQLAWLPTRWELAKYFLRASVCLRGARDRTDRSILALPAGLWLVSLNVSAPDAHV